MIDVQHPQLSVRQQCALIQLHRSNLYYQPREVSDYNLLLMRLLDEIYTRYPMMGVVKMTHYLKSLGHTVNPKRVRRLLRLLGLEAIYPKPNTSGSHPNHPKYPYLLGSMEITRPNQAWCTDISVLQKAA